jgi:hypothetical protein
MSTIQASDAGEEEKMRAPFLGKEHTHTKSFPQTPPTDQLTMHMKPRWALRERGEVDPYASWLEHSSDTLASPKSSMLSSSCALRR